MKYVTILILTLIIMTTNSFSINLDPYFSDDLYAKDNSRRSADHIVAFNCDLSKEQWDILAKNVTEKNEELGKKYGGMANKSLSFHRLQPDINSETPKEIALRKYKETKIERCYYLYMFYSGFEMGLNTKD